MQSQLLRILLLSAGLLGIVSTVVQAQAGRDPGPRPAPTSTDSDAASASSDPETDAPQDGDDQDPPATHKGRKHPERKHHPRLWPDVRAELRAREEQVDRALHKLMSVKADALQLLHGTRPHHDADDSPDDAPAADR